MKGFTSGTEDFTTSIKDEYVEISKQYKSYFDEDEWCNMKYIVYSRSQECVEI